MLARRTSPSGTLASRRARTAMGLSRAGPKAWTVSPNTWQRRKSSHPQSMRQEDRHVAREQELRDLSSGRNGGAVACAFAREGTKVFLAGRTRESARSGRRRRRSDRRVRRGRRFLIRSGRDTEPNEGGLYEKSNRVGVRDAGRRHGIAGQVAFPILE